ncbi:MAG: dockerin type I repeat-containing protein [Muribaculaceae bacterium]|nr:dockerin type I repeat-containing protein [Muribaculaceae bacterium]
MKKFLCFMMMSLPLLWCGAQDADYVPLAEEGKVWHMVKQHPLPPDYEEFETDFLYEYFIKGDTVIAGRPCKKMYRYNWENSGVAAFNCGIYDEDGKVFQVRDDGMTKLLYDFSAEVGDVVTLMDDSGNYEFKFHVEEVRQVNIRGVNRRALLVGSEGGCGWWIEGIGCDLGPLNDILLGIPGSPYYWSDCELNGKVVCDWRDFSKLYHFNPISNADVNGDGMVDVEDVNIAISHMLGNDVSTIFYADVNGDGVVDITDVNIVIGAMLE